MRIKVWLCRGERWTHVSCVFVVSSGMYSEDHKGAYQLVNDTSMYYIAWLTCTSAFARP